jgi:hypothetical protein
MPFPFYLNVALRLMTKAKRAKKGNPSKRFLNKMNG